MSAKPPQGKSSAGIIIFLAFFVIVVVTGLVLYFFNLVCPYGYSCPSTPAPSGDQPSANQPSVNQPSANQPSVNQPSANQPSANQPSANQPASPPFLGAPQPQISGKNFIPLASLYGTFVIAPDTTGRGSNHVYKTPSVYTSNWWDGGNIRMGPGVANSTGNLKFIRIGQNIGKIVTIGAFDVYVYFVDSNGNPVPTPYTAQSTPLTHIDLGDFSPDQPGAQPDPSLPLNFMPKTFACLVDETPSGPNCLIPAAYTNYTDNAPPTFTYTPNAVDPTKKQRPKGFCVDGWGQRPHSLYPNDPSNACGYMGSSPATAPGIVPGPDPTFAQAPGPVTSCPCNTSPRNGQCVTLSGGPYVATASSGTPFCNYGDFVAPDGVTCYNPNNQYAPTYPAALKC